MSESRDDTLKRMGAERERECIAKWLERWPFGDGSRLATLVRRGCPNWDTGGEDFR